MYGLHIIFANTINEKQGNLVFSRTVIVMLNWTVQENYTVYLKNNKQFNSLALFT